MKNLILSLFLVLGIYTLKAQNSDKKSLDFNILTKWKTISSYGISDNGTWIYTVTEPYKGDGELQVQAVDKKQIISIPRGTATQFSPNSDYFVCKVVPPADSIRKLKINKVDKKKFPSDSLLIYNLINNQQKLYPKIQSIKLPDENSGWLAFTYEKVKEEVKDTAKKDEKKKKVKTYDNSAPKAYQLVVANPGLDKYFEFEQVSAFDISENGKVISFFKQQNDSLIQSGLFVFNTDKMIVDSISVVKGSVTKLSNDYAGNQLSFMFTADTAKVKTYSLYYFKIGTKSLEKIVDTTSKNLPVNWTVAEKSNLYFSKDGLKLFFGTALKPEQEKKDTIPDDEKVKVDIWSWTDTLLQSQQLNRLSTDKERNYQTIYWPSTGKIIKLADDQCRNFQFAYKGNNNIGFCETSFHYQAMAVWESPLPSDFYAVNAQTGQKTLLIKGKKMQTYPSADGNFVAWYHFTDSTWNVTSVKTMQTINLTQNLPVAFFDEENDIPSLPYSYGFAGWAADNKHFFVYDKYDIWKFEVSGKFPPENVTNSYGRKNLIEFRYIKTNPDDEVIPYNSRILLRAFGENDKKSGFFTSNLSRIADPEKLMHDNYLFQFKVKSKNTSLFLFTKEAVNVFPDMYILNTELNVNKQITDLNYQHKTYNWATVELVKWTTFDGLQEEGLLYKPENFDPAKKYPMIVYFYELSSNSLNRYVTPSPSRSIINPVHYASNGYLVFIPNIRYTTGYPGQSAYNYIVSGTMALLANPWVDKTKLGLQGQSWGGYQTAYLITQTNIFAAAEAGAPVSNMTSAYGGIRWESGMSRMFQYERSQSRIGGNLWDKLPLYIQNSPLFHVPKVETPLLIMHNDNDGAVPWYQGIELFMALKRLQKPVWLLNYNGEPHNLNAKGPNNLDLTIRMMQFFDHYLKDKPAPVWMYQGIKAVDKGKKTGYELNQN